MGYVKYGMKMNSMFSQRHYEAIAQKLNERYLYYKNIGMDWAFEPLDSVTRNLEDMFRKDNPNFKPDKFLDAVWRGIKDET